MGYQASLQCLYFQNSGMKLKNSVFNEFPVVADSDDPGTSLSIRKLYFNSTICVWEQAISALQTDSSFP